MDNHPTVKQVTTAVGVVVVATVVTVVVVYALLHQSD
jgi:hypothetical protein